MTIALIGVVTAYAAMFLFGTVDVLSAKIYYTTAQADALFKNITPKPAPLIFSGMDRLRAFSILHLGPVLVGTALVPPALDDRGGSDSRIV